MEAWSIVLPGELWRIVLSLGPDDPWSIVFGSWQSLNIDLWDPQFVL